MVLISGKQFIATYLNLLSCGLTASDLPTPDLQTCYQQLLDFYSGSCTAELSDRAWLVGCATFLDAVNNGGVAGFPHCTDEVDEISGAVMCLETSKRPSETSLS